jgi:hypothetical protein
MQPDNDGGWGSRGELPHDTLTIYRPDGAWESANASATPGFNHEGCLFLRDLSPGQMLIYRAEDAARMLAEPNYSGTLKERIAEGISRFSPEQKKWMAEKLSPEALATIRHYSAENAAMMEALITGSRNVGRVSEISSGGLTHAR